MIHDGCIHNATHRKCQDKKQNCLEPVAMPGQTRHKSADKERPIGGKCNRITWAGPKTGDKHIRCSDVCQRQGKTFWKNTPAGV